MSKDFLSLSALFLFQVSELHLKIVLLIEGGRQSGLPSAP